MTKPSTVIFHNPACSTSRNTLARLRNAGREPTVIEYLKTGWTRDQLRELASKSGGGVRGLLRKKEKLASELGLLNQDASDEQLLEAMIAHPVLVDRPIVVTERGVRLCRPSETVDELL